MSQHPISHSHTPSIVHWMLYDVTQIIFGAVGFSDLLRICDNHTRNSYMAFPPRVILRPLIKVRPLPKTSEQAHPSVSRPLAHTHKQTHIQAYTHTCAHTHARIHPRIHVYAHPHSLTPLQLLPERPLWNMLQYRLHFDRERDQVTSLSHTHNTLLIAFSYPIFISPATRTMRSTSAVSPTSPGSR